jgi:chromodomain-helicase-DNA-binding protein 7
LRPYQLEGLNWMSLNWHLGHNSILADEMGLGKTVQTVSLLHYLHETQGVWGPFLVIAPLSTLGHWQRELQSWTELNTIVYHGNAAARQAILEHEWWFGESITSGRKAHQLHKFNVLLTTCAVPAIKSLAPPR